MKRFAAIAGLAILTGCASTPPDPTVCSSNDQARLNGLRVGAGIKTPNPETTEGQRVLGEIAQLEAKCAKPAP